MKRASPLLIAVFLAGCGTDVTGPSSSLLPCVFGEARSTQPGEVVQVAGAGNRVCLDGGAGAEFVYIPFYGPADDTTGDLTLDLTGAGFSPLSGIDAGRIALGPAGASLSTSRPRDYVIDYGFHDRLRRREVTELEPLIRPGGAVDAVDEASSRASTAADVPSVGDLRDLNVAISCTQQDIRTGEVVYVSDHAVVMADTANPADLTTDDYAFFGETFDTLVYPIETVHFGTPTDIDANGRSILFFTRAVNELNPAGSGAVTIGFFWSGDLFPETGTDRLQACPLSNHGEMFYLIAPDPEGVAGVEFELDDVRRLAIPLIGHEYQHLINASRRLFVNTANTFEDPWLNEGLSHAAEEILFLHLSGLGTGTNIGGDAFQTQEDADLFNQYMGGNFNNLRRYLQGPDTASLMGQASRLTTRGGAWSFLRYAADRSDRTDADFFFDVVNATNAGLANLNDVLGSGAALEWMRDWTVSLYTDDRVAGVEPRFTADTWNMPSVFERSTVERYPLSPRTLESGATSTLELAGGAAGFTRFGVAAGDRAIVHTEVDGRPPPAALRGSFLRVR